MRLPLLVLLGTSFATPTTAQRIPPELAPGDRVRVTLASADSARVTGRLVSADWRSVTLDTHAPGGFERSWDRIRLVEVSRGVSQRRAAWRGATWGMFIGGTLGSIAGILAARELPTGTPTSALIGVGSVGVVGGGIGASIGAFRAKELWLPAVGAPQLARGAPMKPVGPIVDDAAVVVAVPPPAAPVLAAPPPAISSGTLGEPSASAEPPLAMPGAPSAGVAPVTPVDSAPDRAVDPDATPSPAAPPPAPSEPEPAPAAAPGDPAPVPVADPSAPASAPGDALETPRSDSPAPPAPAEVRTPQTGDDEQRGSSTPEAQPRP